jgi:hypothetical protein
LRTQAAGTRTEDAGPAPPATVSSPCNLDAAIYLNAAIELSIAGTRLIALNSKIMATKVRLRFRVSPLQKFRRNLVGAEKYLDMYYELRQVKNLGRRGALSKTNDYLLWLPRATVVSAVGALDAYVHDALAAHLPALLADEDFVVSELLAEALGTVMPTKKREDIQNSLRFVRAANGRGYSPKRSGKKYRDSKHSKRPTK